MKKISGLKNLPKFFENDRKLKITVIIGFAIIALILFSDLSEFFILFGSENKTSTDVSNADSYISELEARLVGIVSEIEGAGRVKIMLTLESLDESVYSERETAVKTTKPPVVRGVAVVCGGGGDITVKAKIVETVSKVLGISSSRVCVTN